MTELRPFGPAAATTLASLSLETDEDSLVITGTLEIRRDAAGLANARRLAAIAKAAVDAIAADMDAESQTNQLTGPERANPFT